MRDFHEIDTLRIRVTVRDSAGSAVDLTGASFVAVIGGTGRGADPGAAGTVTPVTLASGVVDIEFAPDSAAAPSAVVQLRVTLAGETQTVYAETFTVRRSLRTA